MYKSTVNKHVLSGQPSQQRLTDHDFTVMTRECTTYSTAMLALESLTAHFGL